MARFSLPARHLEKAKTRLAAVSRLPGRLQWQWRKGAKQFGYITLCSAMKGKITYEILTTGKGLNNQRI